MNTSLNQPQNKPVKDIKKEVGFVVSAQDYLLYLEGLPSVAVNDIIRNDEGSRALISGLDKNRIEALMLDPSRTFPGDTFSIYPPGLNIPLSDILLGRSLNPLGVPLDGKGTLHGAAGKINLDTVAGGINTREIITEQLFTGMTMVDSLLPLGRGQRELIFGEPRSGKSVFIRDIIANQKNNNIICIYTACGISGIDLKKFVDSLTDMGALKYTIIIAATSSDSAPLIAIAPAVALSVAEYFRNSGKNVLLFIDDLGIHSKYLREIGLLSGRIPGRESYPADIFYQHSHLVERAGKFDKQNGEASITLLPIIETDLENFTNLIPTNVMSMTDGHLLFSASLRAQGKFPAIVATRSVTRVGHQCQSPLLKSLSDKIRQLIADYQELERYGRFGSELTMETQLTIKKGLIAEELLSQERGSFIDPRVQILLLSLLFTHFFDTKDIDFVKRNKENLIKALSEGEIYKKMVDPNNSDLKAVINVLEQHVKDLEAVCSV